MDVCSLTDGAWYAVRPEECSIVWFSGAPCIRVKFKGFGYDECDLFALENLFQERFRMPFQVVKAAEELEIGQRILGFARSETEQKWFEATVERIDHTADDVVVTVEWCLGTYFLIFGAPINTKLSINNGEIGLLQRVLSPTRDAVLQEWTAALRELSGSTTEFVERPDRVPPRHRTLFQSLPLDVPPETYSPVSFLRRQQKRKLVHPPQHNDE